MNGHLLLALFWDRGVDVRMSSTQLSWIKEWALRRSRRFFSRPFARACFDYKRFSSTNLSPFADPAIQERVRRQMMAAASGERLKSPASGDPGAATPRQNGTSAAGQHVTSDEPGGEESVATSSSTSSSSAVARKCELFTMTGDLIITKASSTKTPATRTQSTPASPGGDPQRGTKREASSLQSPVAEKKGSFGVRTSRSDDHLGKARGTVAAVSIDIDDDEMASSLNTLLDTKDDSRVLWTYNAGSSEDDEEEAEKEQPACSKGVVSLSYFSALQCYTLTISATERRFR
ncbi:hypothetical protein HPB51_017525 [Rhipicephalus microplus]|uniref:Uncharacterized protein n=1 Tax=Rhipicephalus microplus TaxID=6941 RepID=A0A9J6F4V5_RHIMP|nr:hypothetical protein HPB51_017525 [Rhipicephalus microplus]